MCSAACYCASQSIVTVIRSTVFARLIGRNDMTWGPADLPLLPCVYKTLTISLSAILSHFESQGCINWLTMITSETPSPTAVPFPVGKLSRWVPPKTLLPGTGPTCTPSSIHPTVWPQYTNVISRVNRHTGHRYRSIGRTVTCNGHPESMVLDLRGGVYYRTSNKNISLP